jgi:hypothetical protein
MTSIFARQLWSGLAYSSFLRPTIQIQPSIRTKIARRIARNRIPTHAKPSDKWMQKKSVYEMNIIIDFIGIFYCLELE